MGSLSRLIRTNTHTFSNFKHEASFPFLSSREWPSPTPTSKTTSAMETPGNLDGSNPNTKTTMVSLTCTPVKSLPTPTTKVSELVKTLNSTLDQLNSINSATPVKILPFNSLSNTTKKS